MADERATLTGFLQYQRETLAMKCAGLTAEQLRDRAVPPSDLSLLGLVRHMAEVERVWFRNVLNGENSRDRWTRENGEHADFDVETADPDEAFEIWHQECARSRDLVDAAESLDVTGRRRDEDFSLRWILTHMIEEYARHNGHADLLRERIDGATGE
ncbi:DinB family protein [Spirillospora sp. CA-255316]